MSSSQHIALIPCSVYCRTRVSDADKRAILDRAIDGETVPEICHALGVADKVTRRVLAQHGVVPRMRKADRLDWTDERADALEELFDQGLGALGIARALTQRWGFTVSADQVQTRINVMGLTREDSRAIASLQRPTERHRRAAMCRLGIDPQDAHHFPRRIALVATAIAMEQAR